MKFLDSKTNEVMIFKLTATRKSAIKKAFALAHNLKRTVTLVQIKKAYPKLNFSKALSWFVVLADSLEILDNNDTPKELTHKEQLENAIASTDCEIYSPDYLLGISYKVNYNRDYLGVAGFSEMRSSWFYVIGRNGRLTTCASAHHAIKILMHVRGYKSLSQKAA